MILDLFAGPGGWEVGARSIGVHVDLGIEWDKHACATAEAAGFARLQADIATLDPRTIAPSGLVGLIASPPCLGWGFDEPSATVSGGGAATGGAEPFGNAGYRKRLGERVRTNQRPDIGLGNEGPYQRRDVEDPAPSITGLTRSWAWERPATTTIVGSFRPDVVSAPGYRTEVSRQDAEGSVRVSVQEAAILQSFPADHPWQGSRTRQFLQVGNAVPPRLAAHVLRAVGAVPREGAA